MLNMARASIRKRRSGHDPDLDRRRTTADQGRGGGIGGGAGGHDIVDQGQAAAGNTCAGARRKLEGCGQVAPPRRPIQPGLGAGVAAAPQQVSFGTQLQPPGDSRGNLPGLVEPPLAQARRSQRHRQHGIDGTTCLRDHGVGKPFGQCWRQIEAFVVLQSPQHAVPGEGIGHGGDAAFERRWLGQAAAASLDLAADGQGAAAAARRQPAMLGPARGAEAAIGQLTAGFAQGWQDGVDRQEHARQYTEAMPSDERAVSAARPVDGGALQRQLARLERQPEPPWLHTEAARRMAERLAWIKRSPQQIVDWWARQSASQALLSQAHPKAEYVALERNANLRDMRLQAQARPWWALARRARAGRARIVESELQAASADLVWANMVLHWVADPQVLMRQWQRALKVEGFLMFTTLGPGSLALLRAVYAEAGWGPPHAPLVDMHDLGDMLVEAGFAEPVMDQEILTLTFADPGALLRELRGLGGNADPRRSPGLRTPRWRERLLAALAARAGADGRIGLEVELVYGHAFKAAPKARVAAETQIGLEAMREMMRAGRR
jgi:malonyl-CoA O-methyltransferase